MQATLPVNDVRSLAVKYKAIIIDVQPSWYDFKRAYDELCTLINYESTDASRNKAAHAVEFRWKKLQETIARFTQPLEGDNDQADND
jgi:hypothetical protein